MRKCRNFAVNQIVANMKVVIIESEAYKKLMQKIDRIYSYAKKQAKEDSLLQSNPSEIWISDQDAADMLRVSKRTMQRLRSNGDVTYSIRGNKAWYTLTEVKRLLAGRVVRNYKTKGASHE
jgi:plasmid maintenance system killer protein